MPTPIKGKFDHTAGAMARISVNTVPQKSLWKTGPVLCNHYNIGDFLLFLYLCDLLV